MLVYSIGKEFTRSRSTQLREFILSMKTSRFPTMAPFTVSMRVISGNGMNQFGNTSAMSTALKAILLGMVGAMVGDIHRILVQGGVFLYPGTVKKPEGACSMSLL